MNTIRGLRYRREIGPGLLAAVAYVDLADNRTVPIPVIVDLNIGTTRRIAGLSTPTGSDPATLVAVINP